MIVASHQAILEYGTRLHSWRGTLRAIRENYCFKLAKRKNGRGNFVLGRLNFSRFYIRARRCQRNRMPVLVVANEDMTVLLRRSSDARSTLKFNTRHRDQLPIRHPPCLAHPTVEARWTGHTHNQKQGVTESEPSESQIQVAEN